MSRVHQYQWAVISGRCSEKISKQRTGKDQKAEGKKARRRKAGTNPAFRFFVSLPTAHCPLPTAHCPPPAVPPTKHSMRKGNTKSGGPVEVPQCGCCVFLTFIKFFLCGMAVVKWAATFVARPAITQVPRAFRTRKGDHSRIARGKNVSGA